MRDNLTQSHLTSFMLKIHLFLSPDNNHIYTVGSKQGMKVSCAAIIQSQELLKRLPNESPVHSAEVTAVDRAMNESTKSIIYTD